ncbi:ATP-binding protein [Halobaculum roseum]|uniref:histidine kinase n=1 Tax=Halobaculum roseum TaxID=2175149 RepID=A0ABD5MNV9_9EURY|nr:ATP-binding protein [Halobaculum roseum]QZY03388.1 PAS domain-containing protein [Halobaculum roseum]
MTACSPHVLYVDPDAGCRDRIADELRRELPDVTVTTVRSADEAVDAVADAREIDCVASAFDLPDGDALDLLAQVRDGNGGLPFVLFADGGDERVASDAITAGVSEYVRSDRRDPYRTLARRVREVVEGRTPDDSAGTRSSDGRHRLLVEGTDQPMAVLEDGRYRLVNDACVDLVGVPRERILGSSDDDLFPAETARTLREHSDDALAAGERREHRIDAEVNGEATVLDIVHFPDPDADGRRVVGRVARDVTDRVDRERLLRTERDRLEALSSAVAHDARNAIQVIRGRALLAEESLPDDAEESREHLSALDVGVDRLGDLVDSLESLRGLNDPVTDPMPVSIAEAARDAWATVAAPDATLRVRADPLMLGDPARVRTMLENLFRNSVEHGSSATRAPAEPAAERVDGGDPCGGGADSTPTPRDDRDGSSVTVTVDALDDARGFAVSDDGSGIPEDERDRVLEFGYSPTGGTGLGLGIVSGIADAHGWQIDVADSDSGGARFELRQETLDSFVS